jgi:hypothetical protein
MKEAHIAIDLDKLEAKSDNGYFIKCPAEGCSWTSDKYEFRGSARLRFYSHLDEVIG